jgi:hypothetical protein
MDYLILRRNTMYTAHFHNNTRASIGAKRDMYHDMLRPNNSTVQDLTFSVASSESSAVLSGSQLYISDEIITVDSFDWTPVKLIPIRSTEWINFEPSSTIPQIVTCILNDNDDVTSVTDDDDMDTTDDFIEILNEAAMSYPDTNVFNQDSAWRFDIDHWETDVHSGYTMAPYDPSDDLMLSSTCTL